tara:strand:+ start:823 stop:1143 length:321 start_codon:yes stop_codon:yes gene_type:complete
MIGYALVVAYLVLGSLGFAHGTQPPVIAFPFDNPMTILVSTPFNSPTPTCTDPEDGDISSQIQIGGQFVNGSVEGTYTISYDCSDSDGNAAAQMTLIVHVVASLAD